MIKKLALGLIVAGLSVAATQAQVVATDNFEGVAGADDYDNGIQYGDNGGTGFGAITYLEGTGGGVFLEAGGRQTDGARSFGIFSSTGGQAASRSIAQSGGVTVGTYSLSARFDLSNTTGFSGFNIKSDQGNTFGSSELLAFGLLPANGNNVISLFGTSAITLNLGSAIPGRIVDFTLSFDTLASTYTLGAKFREDATFTSVSGNLKDVNGATAGTDPVAFLGFGNFNTGTDQSLIADNLTVTAVPEPSSLSLLAGPAILGAWFFMRRRRS